MVGKNLRTTALLLLLFLITVSSASALTVSDLRFEQNGKKMEYISLGQRVKADIFFNINGDFHEVKVDLSGLVKDPVTKDRYENISVAQEQCEYDNDTVTYECPLWDMALNLDESNATIPFHVVEEKDGPVDTQNLKHKFKVDNTRPELTEIKTDYCKEGICYIKPGEPTNITLKLEDKKGSFDKKMIFFSVGRRSFRVRNCTTSGETTTCTASVVINCAYKSNNVLELSSGGGVYSQDDAGNRVKSKLEQETLCDSQAPKLRNITYSSNNDFNLLVEGSELYAIAKLSEELSGIKAEANFSGVSDYGSESAECKNKEGFDYECKWTITNLKPGSGEIKYRFSDNAGNGLKRTDEIKVLKSGNTTNETDYFTSVIDKVTPSEINREMLGLAHDNAKDFLLFVTYHFKRNRGRPTLLEQKVDTETCYYDMNGDGNYTDERIFDEVSVQDETADYDQKNRLNIKLSVFDPAEMPDKIGVRCTARLKLRTQEAYYGRPEKENITFTLKLKESVLGTPGKAFLEKIKDAKENLDSGFWNVVGKANKIMATLGDLCNLKAYFEVIKGAGSGMEVTGQALQQVGGQALVESGNAMYAPLLMTSLNSWAGYSQDKKAVTEAAGTNPQEESGILAKACKWSSCHTGEKMREKQGKGKSGVFSGGQEFSDKLTKTSSKNAYAKNYMGELTKNLNTPDVKNSLLMSMMSRCLPGVIYNLNKWRQVECGYLQCLEDRSASGGSTAVCEEAKGVKLCRQVVGEIFELPFIRTIKNLGQNIQFVANNALPIFFKSFLEQKGTCHFGKAEDTSPPSIGCHVAETILSVKRYKQVSSNPNFFTPIEKDLCAEVLDEGEPSYVSEYTPNQDVRDRMFSEKKKERTKEYNKDWIKTVEDMKRVYNNETNNIVGIKKCDDGGGYCWEREEGEKKKESEKSEGSKGEGETKIVIFQRKWFKFDGKSVMILRCQDNNLNNIPCVDWDWTLIEGDEKCKDNSFKKDPSFGSTFTQYDIDENEHKIILGKEITFSNKDVLGMKLCAKAKDSFGNKLIKGLKISESGGYKEEPRIVIDQTKYFNSDGKAVIEFICVEEGLDKILCTDWDWIPIEKEKKCNKKVFDIDKIKLIDMAYFDEVFENYENNQVLRKIIFEKDKIEVNSKIKSVSNMEICVKAEDMSGNPLIAGLEVEKSSSSGGSETDSEGSKEKEDSSGSDGGTTESSNDESEETNGEEEKTKKEESTTHKKLLKQAEDYIKEYNKKNEDGGFDLDLLSSGNIDNYLKSLREGEEPKDKKELNQLMTANAYTFGSEAEAESFYNSWNSYQKLKELERRGYDITKDDGGLVVKKNGEKDNALTKQAKQYYSSAKREFEVDCDGECTANKNGNEIKKDKVQEKAQDYLKNRKRVYQNQLASVAVKIAEEEGALKFLETSDWGDWGQEVVDKASLLDPESWKNNLCNPAGKFQVESDRGAVYSFTGDYYKAVLTIAGEKTSQDKKTLYTVKYFLKGNNKRKYEYQVYLQPGRKAVTEKSTLKKDGKKDFSKPYLYKKDYKEVCIEFDKKYPNPTTGTKKICREIEKA